MIIYNDVSEREILENIKQKISVGDMDRLTNQIVKLNRLYLFNGLLDKVIDVPDFMDRAIGDSDVDTTKLRNEIFEIGDK